jgi:hypothetical protein
MCVLVRVRGWFDGAGWFVGGAVALFVFAVLAVLLELQSPEIVLWTGQPVVGTEQHGIVYYQWQGQSYSLDAKGYGSAKALTVYVDPGNPSNAMVDSVADRLGPSLLVGLPALGGVILLVVGGTRSYRWKRRNARQNNEWWLSRIPPQLPMPGRHER